MVWFLGQKLKVQGHKVQKHIEGDRVAGVSLHTCQHTCHRHLYHVSCATSCEQRSVQVRAAA